MKVRQLARLALSNSTQNQALSTALPCPLVTKSMLPMTISKCAPTRPTVAGEKKHAPPAPMASCAPSRARTATNGPTHAPEAAGVRLVFKPNVLQASSELWNEESQRLRLALTALLATTVRKELQTLSLSHVQRVATVRTESLSLLVLQEPSTMISTARVSLIARHAQLEVSVARRRVAVESSALRATSVPEVPKSASSPALLVLMVTLRLVRRT